MAQFTHLLAGIPVRFPYEKPYSQQKVMMSRLITALKQHKNCLIESPTGTGKSLSLLCGALSFVEEQKRLRKEAFEKLSLPPSTSALPLDTCSTLHMGYTPAFKCEFAKSSTEEVTRPKTVLDMFDDLGTQAEPRGAVKIHSASNRKSLLNRTSTLTDETKAKLNDLALNDQREKSELPPVPKIFYGTRTHRQVSQVVSEFSRTDYGKMPMTILASRDRMCVHRGILQRRNKAAGTGMSINEECRALMKLAKRGEGCILYAKLQKASHTEYPTSISGGSGDPWDIEDLRKVGEQHTRCPYYWSVQLAETANIIFCPYNYILDPTVREAMKIDLKGNIVILDEAHNIEDICRDSMGLELNLSDILYIDEFIQSAMVDRKESRAMAQILPIVGSLKHVLQNQASEITLTEPQVFDHERLCSLLEKAQLGPATWPRTKKIVAALLTPDEDTTPSDTDETTEGTRELDARCRAVFGSIANTLGHLYKMDMQYIACFRAAIAKLIPQTFVRELRGNPEVKLNIYCLNPAVGLVDIKDTLHSLVVASGTLSPMKSFQCELDVPFPVSISLNHVIDKNQMLARIATRGPDRVDLKCDYKNNTGFTLQDDVGRAIVRICSKIPNGVLCFFPSYNVMKRMSERWQTTGAWSELQDVKNVFVEGQSNLPRMMQEYFETSLSSKGAILMAVCRGRVSEGEDFPDNFARAVIVIGLPFPNSQDTIIKDKMAFNDCRHRQGAEVMNGKDWYGAQAFRALNQALGRCIRHADDWGAIILLESRIAHNPRYKEMLSRWIRDHIVDTNDFNALDGHLSEFVQERRVEDEVGNSGGGVSAREMAKLQGGSGLNNSRDVDSPGQDGGGGTNGGRSAKKRARKNFPLFEPSLKRRSSGTANERSGVDVKTAACSSPGCAPTGMTPVTPHRLGTSAPMSRPWPLQTSGQFDTTTIVVEGPSENCLVLASPTVAGHHPTPSSNHDEAINGRMHYLTASSTPKIDVAVRHNDDDDDEDASSSDLFSD